jgi:hypothetical protein
MLMQLAATVWGCLRARAAGIGQHDLTLQRLNQQYAAIGLRRERRIFGTFRDGVLGGAALAYSASVPMNFSLLCNRTELLIHPDAPDREQVVAELAHTARWAASARHQPLCPLLVDPADVPAALAVGFQATGKQYSNFLWARENQQGWPSSARAIHEMYALLERRAVKSMVQTPVL